MARFKPAKGKRKSARAPQGGLPCVILLISGIVLAMFFVIWILSQSHAK